jgi:hypothetical protein
MVKRTTPLHHNRLFEDEEEGRRWAERMLRKPEMKGCELIMEWRKIKYAPNEPKIFSVTLTKEAQGWDV